MTQAEKNKVPNGKSSSPTVYIDDGHENLDDTYRFGYFNCKPNWLQCFNTPRVLLACISWFTFTQGFGINGIIYTNFTSWERRYGYTSTQISWISGSYEFLAALITLLFGYIGQWVHNGRILCIGAFSISIGSFIMTLPHFISGIYQYGPMEIEVCDLSGNNSSECISEAPSSYYAYFIIAQCFHAVGGAAVHTLGIPYMDDQIKTKNTPVYIGIMQGNAAFGPAMGYILGGYFLSFYVDINKDIEVDITPSDPRWVGAWWIGMLISGFCSLTVAFLMGCFPKELPTAKKYRNQRKSEAYKHKITENEKQDSSNDKRDSLLYSLKILFTNPVWAFITVSGVVESAGVAGFSAFLPKVLQFQFVTQPGYAGAIAGLVIVPGAVGGQIVGGIIPKVFKLRIRGLLMQSCLCSLVALALSFQFLLRCPTNPIAGVTAPYYNKSVALHPDDVEVIHPCNEACNCTTESYDPVCGYDESEYFSPCHAGCTESTQEDGYVLYTNCECVDYPYGIANTSVTIQVPGYTYTGICETDCGAFGPFLILFFFMNLVTFMSFTSGSAVNIRCVPDKQRTISNAVTRFIARLLGEVPGVVVFGYVFDYSCLIFQENACGDTGACWIYETKFVSEYIFWACVVIKGVSVLSFLMAFILYRPPIEGNEITVEVSNEINDFKLKYDMGGYVNSLSEQTYL